MKNTEVEILRTLKQIGISPNILGYKYLKAAVDMVMENESVLHGGVTKIMYPEIAAKFDTTPARVERAIRHAIEIAGNANYGERANEIFGYTISPHSGTPTNSQFIACVAEYIQIKE